MNYNKILYLVLTVLFLGINVFAKGLPELSTDQFKANLILDEETLNLNEEFISDKNETDLKENRAQDDEALDLENQDDEKESRILGDFLKFSSFIKKECYVKLFYLDKYDNDFRDKIYFSDNSSVKIPHYYWIKRLVYLGLKDSNSKEYILEFTINYKEKLIRIYNRDMKQNYLVTLKFKDNSKSHSYYVVREEDVKISFENQLVEISVI